MLAFLNSMFTSYTVAELRSSSTPLISKELVPCICIGFHFPFFLKDKRNGRRIFIQFYLFETSKLAECSIENLRISNLS